MKFFYLCFFLCVSVYLVTAIKSTGYSHPDEHYQIIEFAAYKSGHNTPPDLAWEFAEQLRPAFQPAIAFILFGALDYININDPYTLAMSLRLVSMLFALIVIFYFVQSSQRFVLPEYRKAYIILSFFLWFLPFLNVRFSSENFSGLFFLLSIVLIQTNENKNKNLYILIGLFQGLAFLCRFQSAILSAGFLVWLIFINKQDLKSLLRFIGGATLAILAGTLIDTWFYGQLVFTPWNYFNVNILQGIASSFGIEPWYFYFLAILKKTFFPFGVIILSSLCLFTVKNRKNIVIYIVIPFLFIHAIIPHKEYRFLFPLINFIPLIIILGFQELVKFNFFKKKLNNRVFYVIIYLFFILNCLFLAATAYKSAGNSSKEITAYIHTHYANKRINLITTLNNNPYQPYLGLTENFYKDKLVKFTFLDLMHQKNDVLIRNDAVNIICLKKNNLGFAFKDKAGYFSKFSQKKQSVPGWIQSLINYYDKSENDNTYTLYTYEKSH